MTISPRNWSLLALLAFALLVLCFPESWLEVTGTASLIGGSRRTSNTEITENITTDNRNIGTDQRYGGDGSYFGGNATISDVGSGNTIAVTQSDYGAIAASMGLAESTVADAFRTQRQMSSDNINAVNLLTHTTSDIFKTATTAQSGIVSDAVSAASSVANQMAGVVKRANESDQVEIVRWLVYGAAGVAGVYLLSKWK